MKKSPGRKQRRVGLREGEPLWASAGAIGSGRLLNPIAVKKKGRKEELK